MTRKPCRSLVLAAALALGAALPAAAAERALLIGIDTYKDPDLAKGGFGAAARDVDGVRKLLTGTLGYSEAAIRVLMNEEASRAAILENLSGWLGDTKSGDHVFLYFSGLGHFVADEGGDESDKLDEALVPADAAPGKTDDTLDGLITDDEVMAALQKLPGRKITVVLDAGFSGRVTRGSGAGAVQGVRAPVFAAKTRKIVVEPAAQAQKAEAAVFEEVPSALDVSIWTAASGSQVALVDPPDPNTGRGVFTDLYVKGLAGKAADANGNGTISNAELLEFTRKGSAEICGKRKADCEMGLVPALGPDDKLALAPERVVGEEAPPKQAAAEQVPAEQAPPETAASETLTLDKVTDMLGAKIDGKLRIEQFPPSPVKVGTRDIRFKVTSAVDGFLVLLSLESDGTLTQLFPNQFSRDNVKDGKIRAGHTLMVPDAYYGFRINATAPSSGSLVAVLLSEPAGSASEDLKLPPAVRTRKIEVIPREEAEKTFLPELAKAGTQLGAGAVDVNTTTAERRVAVLPYKIVKP